MAAESSRLEPQGLYTLMSAAGGESREETRPLICLSEQRAKRQWRCLNGSFNFLLRHFSPTSEGH